MDPVAEGMTIVMADDDAEDCTMTGKALAASRAVADLRFVGDGEELMNYLLRRGEYADPLSSPRPSMILLDLNMPKKDGYAALEEIKTHPEIRRIPIVVLTTSNVEEDKTSTLVTTPVRARSLQSPRRIKAWSKQ